MLTRSKKEEIVSNISDSLKRQNITVFTRIHGISVMQAQTLRRALKQDEAEYKVARKTLLQRALKDSDIDFNAMELEGEIGVTFGYNDQVGPAKTLVKFSREHNSFELLGGLLNSRILDLDALKALAKLPTREVVLAQLAATFQSPIRGLAIVLQGNIKNLVNVLERIKEQKA